MLFLPVKAADSTAAGWWAMLIP